MKNSAGLSVETLTGRICFLAYSVFDKSKKKVAGL